MGGKKRKATAVAPRPSRGFPSGPGGASTKGGNPFAEVWSRRAANAAQRSLAARMASRASRRNAFADRRIGEADEALGEEDRYLARLQRERSMRAAKRARFALPEEDGAGDEAGDVLTHRGMPIAETAERQREAGLSILRDDYVEQSLDEDDGSDGDVEDGLGGGLNGRSGAEEEEEEEGGLGLLRRVDRELGGVDEPDGGDERTKGEIMSEVIAKSKMHKAERQREKAQIDDQTAELDRQLPDILTMLRGSEVRLQNLGENSGLFGAKNGEAGGATAQRAADGEASSGGGPLAKFDYDKVFVQLAGEKRAYATNRTKTQEEKDAEEREELEALEKLRLRRMSTIDEDDAEPDASSKRQKRAAGVAAIGKTHVGGDDLEDDFLVEADDHGQDSSDDDGESSDDEYRGDSGEPGEGHELPTKGTQLKSWVAAVMSKTQTMHGSRKDKCGERVGGDGGEVVEGDGRETEDVDSFQWQVPPTAARLADESLPFIYTECPQNYRALAILLKDMTTSQCNSALSRVRACFAVSLNPVGNKPKLVGLLRAALSSVDVACNAASVENNVDLLLGASDFVAMITHHIHELAGNQQDILIAWARNHLEEIYTAVTGSIEGGLACRVSPGRLLAVRALVRLFPGSDLRHSIVTPLALLLAHCLSSVPIRTVEDATVGCFCAAALLEILSPAQRICGELICFLAAILAPTAYAPGPEPLGMEFESEYHVSPGLLKGAFASKDAGPLCLGDCLSAVVGSGEDNINNRARRILNAADALCRATLFGGKLKEIRAVMAPVLAALGASNAKLGSGLADEIRRLADNEESARGPVKLYVEKKGCVATKLLNPKFSSENGIYMGKQRGAGGLAMSDLESQRRLRQLVKKEARSASRELRRDAEVTAAAQLHEDDERDALRTAKTAQVRAFMEKQQHEAKLQSKKVAVGVEGLASVGRKRKKW